MRRAAQDSGFAALAESMTGTTAFALSEEDPIDRSLFWYSAAGASAASPGTAPSACFSATAKLEEAGAKVELK